MDSLLDFLVGLSDVWLYIAIFFIAYIENVFPPSPSDVIVLFAGSLVGIGRLDFLPVVTAAILGSTIGFMSMYAIGHWFGDRIVETGKLKFIPVNQVQKVERWFRRYGYWVVVANRFLSGTRAVVSFFAGLSEMNFTATTILSFASAAVWNLILVSCGNELGRNWHVIGRFITTYSQVIIITTLLVAAISLIRFWVRRHNNRKAST